MRGPASEECGPFFPTLLATCKNVWRKVITMHVQAFPNKPTKRLNVYPLPHDVVVGAAAGAS